MNKDKVINDLLSRIATLEYEVERLEQENDLDCNLNKSLLKDIDKAGKEIERLNNIINEFDEWLLGEKMMFYKGSDGETLIRYGETTNKWLELKGDESNGR